MSAFIQDAMHFNSIEESLISALNTGKEYQRFYFPYSMKKAFPKLACYITVPMTLQSEREKVIKEQINILRKLNISTFVLKYYKRGQENEKEIISKELRSGIFWTTHTKKSRALNPTELAKALSGLHYQIEINYLKEIRPLTEKEKNAMFFLTEMINTVCNYIVSNTKEYEEAKCWAIE